jgi:hypothetical protein
MIGRRALLKTQDAALNMLYCACVRRWRHGRPALQRITDASPRKRQPRGCLCLRHGRPNDGQRPRSSPRAPVTPPEHIAQHHARPRHEGFIGPRIQFQPQSNRGEIVEAKARGAFPR